MTNNKFPDDIWTFDDPGKVSRPTLYLNDQWVLAARELWSLGGFNANNKAMMTPEGGFAVRLKNRTGAPSVKGTLVKTSAAYANAVSLVAIGVPDPIGAVYDAGVADGDDMWVVVAGIADVLFVNNSTAGYFARVCTTGDTGAAAGKAFSEAVPTPPFATDKHFMEIGHILESQTAGTLTKTVLHFN